MRKLLLSFIIVLGSVHLMAQDRLARIEFGLAEEAFDKKKYEQSLQHINKTKELLGRTNPKIMYLEALSTAGNRGVLGDFLFPPNAGDALIDDMMLVTKLADHYIKGKAKDVVDEKLKQIYELKKKLEPVTIESKALKNGMQLLREKQFKEACEALTVASSAGNIYAKDILDNYAAPLLKLLENMVYVEGGNFSMGTNTKRKNAKDESPAHEVFLDDFFISKYEVTYEQYKVYELFLQRATNQYTVSHENMYNNESGFPVESINYNSIIRFCAVLSGIINKTLRLPTEAEWEYAARGGVKSKGYLYAGSDNLDDVAVYNQETTATVGTKSPNELGLYDMTGNVWEFCQDHYSKNYYKNSPVNNPVNNTLKSGKAYYPVVRGSSILSKENFRTTERLSSTKGNAYKDAGFRLVMETE